MRNPGTPEPMAPSASDDPSREVNVDVTARSHSRRWPMLAVTGLGVAFAWFDATSTGAATTAPVSPSDATADAATTDGADGILGGTQLALPLTAPVTAGGNAVAIVGDATTTGPTTGPVTPTDPTEPTDPTGPTDPTDRERQGRRERRGRRGRRERQERRAAAASSAPRHPSATSRPSPRRAARSAPCHCGPGSSSSRRG